MRVRGPVRRSRIFWIWNQRQALILSPPLLFLIEVNRPASIDREARSLRLRPEHRRRSVVSLPIAGAEHLFLFF